MTSAVGYQTAAEPLAERLTCIIGSQPELLDSFEFDRIFSEGIAALDRSRNVSQTLSLSTLKLCVEVSTSNTALRAIEAIASFASEEALETLIDLHNNMDGASTEGSLEDQIEQLSGRLGSRVIRDSENVLRVKDN